MPSTIRVALYVFAAVAVLLWITILSVYESRQGSGPPAELLCCLEDLPYGELHDFYSPPPSSLLFALSRDERGEVFRMEILEAGFPCDGVTLMERWGLGQRAGAAATSSCGLSTVRMDSSTQYRWTRLTQAAPRRWRLPPVWDRRNSPREVSACVPASCTT